MMNVVGNEGGAFQQSVGSSIYKNNRGLHFGTGPRLIPYIFILKPKGC
jgi:hypothetical protein